MEEVAKGWAICYFEQSGGAMRHEPEARITFKQSWGSYHLFRFEAPASAAKARPGQFLMIKVNDTPFPLLRRPISIHSREKKTLEIFFQIAGQGTRILARKGEGDSLDFLGPFGKGFDIGGRLKGTSAYLIGGGRGIAPLYQLGRELRVKGAQVKVLYGGKSKADLPLKKKFQEADLDVRCSTDDGSLGFRGFVTELLEAEIERRRPDLMFVCGPDPMMKKTTEIALALGIPAQISLESIMGCGFGACWGCVKRIRKGDNGAWQKICEDGPVFRAEDIIWEGME
jgi:dihydroorotate dehydrogenase electron transfer subunit